MTKVAVVKKQVEPRDLTIDSIESIRALTEQQVSDFWPQIQQVLASQPTAPAVEPWPDEDEPRTLADVKRMSSKQINKQWPVVQAIMQRGV